MKKFVKKVDVDSVPEKYKGLVKPEMTYEDMSILGKAIMKEKFYKIKQKLFWWYYERKSK